MHSSAEEIDDPFDRLLDIAREFNIDVAVDEPLIEVVDIVMKEQDDKVEPSFASRIDEFNAHLELLTMNSSTLLSFLKTCKPRASDLILKREAQHQLIDILPLTLESIHNLGDSVAAFTSTKQWTRPTHTTDFILSTASQLNTSDTLKEHLASKLSLIK